MRTRVTDLLGIRYPIIQGGMQWVGTAELASAVTNAGALGVITALTQPTPVALRKEIARCRDLTDRPSGVNLTILPTVKPPLYSEYLDAALDSGVGIIETAGNSPRDFVDRIISVGIGVGIGVGRIHDVPSCDELIQRMIDECRARLTSVTRFFGAQPVNI